MTQGSARGTCFSDHLDMLRGLAAVAVLVGHARSLLMPSASGGLGAVDRLMYLLSSVATPAVMVFFVLSGFLVGGGVVRVADAGRWSWRQYLLARGVRLYLVLLPALLLTALLDLASVQAVAGKTANDDTAVAVVTTEQIASRSDRTVFVGNLLFLQTIAVETFGSNHALWSLANEAWYYLLFPCLWLAIRRGERTATRLLLGGIALLSAAFVGVEIIALFPIWLMGVAISRMPRLGWLASRSSGVVALVLFASVLLLYGAGKLPRGYLGDYLVALTFALFLLALRHRDTPAKGDWYARLASRLAGCSYTLYLTHLPLLVYMRALWTYEQPWPRDLLHWGMVSLACLACLVYAYLLSLVTEARTDAVRSWIGSRFAAMQGAR